MSDAPVISKVANALVPDADLTPNLTGWQAAVDRWVLGRFKKHYGGLWVGGRLTLTARTLEFHPNALNRGMNVGTLDTVIDLQDVVTVELLPGVFTKIIAVRTGDRIFRSRCYGARRMSDRIRTAAAAATSRTTAEDNG